jgi:transposase
MAAHSQDWCDRVLQGLARGDGARRLEVSVRWVYQVKNRYERCGERGARKVGGYRRSRPVNLEGRIQGWLNERVDSTLAELNQLLAQRGIIIITTALWYKLNKWGLTFKKTLHAGEQECKDVQAARHQWQQSQPTLDVTRLVFPDETGATTNLTRTHGRAATGQRCVASVPYTHRHTTTFIEALRVNALNRPDGAGRTHDGRAFRAYVKAFFCLTLSPGDIVVADNLGSHKAAGVQQAIGTGGATLRFLPPYSLDLNPIEQLFAKRKALLKKAAQRTVKALWQEIGNSFDIISPDECANYLFKAAGYRYD